MDAKIWKSHHSENSRVWKSHIILNNQVKMQEAAVRYYLVSCPFKKSLHQFFGGKPSITHSIFLACTFKCVALCLSDSDGLGVRVAGGKGRCWWLTAPGFPRSLADSPARLSPPVSSSASQGGSDTGRLELWWTYRLENVIYVTL